MKANIVGLEYPTGAGSHHPDGTEANHALTIKLDHSGGADHLFLGPTLKKLIARSALWPEIFADNGIFRVFAGDRHLDLAESINYVARSVQTELEIIVSEQNQVQSDEIAALLDAIETADGNADVSQAEVRELEDSYISAAAATCQTS